MAGSFSTPARAAKNSKASAGDCAGAWTGVVTYTRAQSDSESKTEPRVSGPRDG